MDQPNVFRARKPLRLAFHFLITFLLLWIVSQGLHKLTLLDDFYASAVPNDPVRMGMTPGEVAAVLGKSEDIRVMEDYIQTGIFSMANDNASELRPTGEVILNYERPLMDQNATFHYSYHKSRNRVENLSVIPGPYNTLSEAISTANQVYQHAQTIFEQKGHYTVETKDLHAKFKAEKNRTFYFEINVSYHEIYSDKPYTVSLYQSIF